MNQGALKTYPWPGNLDELREIADGIIAHATLGGLRPPGESLGISHQMLEAGRAITAADRELVQRREAGRVRSVP